MLEYIKGDIFDTDSDVICHQTNCKGVMGSGIALQIKKNFPKAYEAYVKYAKVYGDELLGMIQPVDCGDKTIINLFGQSSYGKDGKRYTDYDAFDTALDKIKTYCEVHNYNIAFPYKIGCGLGGGDWSIIKGLIEKYFEKSDIVCQIYIYSGE